VTKIEPGEEFYPAEDYHQDFLTRNPRYSYIVINDLPKIENLKRLFPDFIAPPRYSSRRQGQRAECRRLARLVAHAGVLWL
jgi:hypothetical protein